jgi:lipopolysaccharide transport system ATP-binding protein
MNSISKQFTISLVANEYKISLHVDRLDLNAGKYYVDVSIYESNWRYVFDSHFRVYSLFVTNSSNSDGIISPPHQWKVI